MHADEVDIDDDLVRRLVASQLPDLAGLPVRAVTPRGTDNALYRLGDALVARLPRHAVSVPGLEKELRWLPHLAGRLSLAIPTPVAAGAPGEGFPFTWAVYRWVEGDPATPERLADPREAALDLARLLGALRSIDGSVGPAPGGRGGPLATRDGPMRAAVDGLGDRIDRAAVLALWDDALAAPVWRGAPVWVHGDLDARNMLASGGRISAVVDWGAMAVGDPACDVMVAWKMVPVDARPLFREAVGADDATWRRARGWAVSQACIALAYYTPQNNAVLVDEAWRWLREALAGA